MLPARKVQRAKADVPPPHTFTGLSPEQWATLDNYLLSLVARLDRLTARVDELETAVQYLASGPKSDTVSAPPPVADDEVQTEVTQAPVVATNETQLPETQLPAVEQAANTP
jgi:hypothetical protein